MYEPHLQCLKGTFIHWGDHSSELRCMIADRHPMVAEVSFFEVADAPTN